MQQYNFLLFCIGLLPLSPMISRRGHSVHSCVTGLASFADIELTLMMRFGKSLCPSILSDPVRIWNTSNNTETQSSWYLLADYCHSGVWNKQSCSPAVLSRMSHHLCQDCVVLGEQLPVPGHTCTGMLILIYSLLEGCVLLLSSTTWRKHHCDPAVQTLSAEPVSPESAIQVNCVVQTHSVILPWALNAPSHITTQKGFLKKPKHCWCFWFFISECLSISSSVLWPS